jgi:antitoxin component of RelBE/YafQ-DinJ toxin-antitoxin module
MNITLSIDERVAERARLAAATMGKSLNQAVRDYLEQLAGRQQLTAQLDAFEHSALQSPGRMNGWHFDREEANRRA